MEEENSMDLYFAGMSHTMAAAKIVSLGCNRLFSQEINRGEIANMVETKKAGKYSGKILIDSGAFTAHTKGIEIDVDEYISYINGIMSYIDVFAQVDHIPGQFGKPKTDKQLAEAPKKSWENYLYMRDRVSDPNKLMPIYHQGEKNEWLKNMLEWTDSQGNHIPYIGISPANDKSQSEKNVFIDMCFKIIQSSSNPNVKTHAYGMTNLKVLETYPFTSADSTSWALTAVNGSIMSPWGVIATSAQNKNSNAFRGMSAHIQNQIINYISQYGYDILDMIEAPEEVVIDRIMSKCNLSHQEVYDVLHCRDTKRPAKRGRSLTDLRPKAGASGKNFSNISKEEAEVIKFEKGRSVKGSKDHKAYLERIMWNIDYLKRWSDTYQFAGNKRAIKTLL